MVSETGWSSAFWTRSSELALGGHPQLADSTDLGLKNPWVFFGIGGALVAYLLYTMVRRRKGERVDWDREPSSERRGRAAWIFTDHDH